jgi:hypothetical protein
MKGSSAMIYSEYFGIDEVNITISKSLAIT